MSKLSSATQTILDAFATANLAYAVSVQTSADAKLSEIGAFEASAIACGRAIKTGVSLGRIATHNAEFVKDNPNAPTKGYYTVKASVAYHGYTGMLLMLPEAVGDDVKPVVGTVAQTVVAKVYRGKGLGADVVKAALKSADTRQGVLASLTAALEGAKTVSSEESVSGGSGESDDESGESFGSAVVDITPDVETLLANILTLVQGGAVLTTGAVATITAILKADRAAA